jgi:glycosyltransferase involved in cell wall biosynthesis
MAAVSVGIPTFNNADTILDTINSLKNQTFLDWECFITDDSEDSATLNAAIVAIGTDPRFTVFKNESRLGAADNWNKTLGLATGQYFKLLCADDLLSVNALALQFEALELNPNSVLCTGRRSIINANGRVLIKNKGLRAKQQILTSDEAINLFVRRGSNYFGEPSFALFRTDALRSTSGFSNSWAYLIDVETYMRCLKFGSLITLNKNLGSFRVSSTSWSATLMNQQRKELLRCIDFANSLPYSDNSRFDIAIGKLRANISSQIRKLFFILNK